MVKIGVILYDNTMALTVKTSRGAKYLYYQAGKESIYIAPKDDPSKAKIENVMRALDYAQERIDHHTESFDELLEFLPPKERKRYVSK